MLGLASRLLSDPQLLSTGFSPVLRHAILRRSSLAGLLDVLAALAAENEQLTTLKGMAKMGRRSLAALQCQLPPGLATRLVRVWLQLQACLGAADTLTLRDIAAAVLPRTMHTYGWLQAVYPSPDQVRPRG